MHVHDANLPFHHIKICLLWRLFEYSRCSFFACFLSTGDRDDFCDAMLEAAIRGWSHCGHKEIDTVSKNAKVDFGI